MLPHETKIRVSRMRNWVLSALGFFDIPKEYSFKMFPFCGKKDLDPFSWVIGRLWDGYAVDRGTAWFYNHVYTGGTAAVRRGPYNTETRSSVDEKNVKISKPIKM
jgi:hypothetical protein